MSGRAQLARFFLPRGIPLVELEVVKLKDEEWEAILLADYKGLEQEESAKSMGVSRPTFSRMLSSSARPWRKPWQKAERLNSGGDFKFVKDKQTRRVT